MVIASLAVLGHLHWLWIPAAVVLETASMAAFAIMKLAVGPSVGVRAMLATGPGLTGVIADQLPAGPGLAGWLANANPRVLPDWDLRGIAAAYRRVASRAAAGELAPHAPRLDGWSSAASITIGAPRWEK